MTDYRLADTPKDATEHTRAKNATVSVPTDMDDFLRAKRGFIASHPTGRIVDDQGRHVWDITRYDFLKDDAPDTANPSLWRQAQLNVEHGLFEVAPHVWQVRGYDISNITFVEGKTGWIVIDPLTSEHTARASLQLVNEHVATRPVVAVIYTHSHADHFGGVLGVVSAADVEAGKCRVIAPEGFLHETVGENVIAGVAMGRRGTYQFGPLLPAGPRTHIDSGLGKSIPIGPPGLIAPTEDITHTGEILDVDGVRVEFQLTPGTEAPTEMNFFFPDYGWLCMAENCSHTMHNLVPIRGAQVRDALSWSKYINESIELFGDRVDVMFTSHHWPRWGRDDVREFLTLQRDVYKWIHDQTMRFANAGFTAPEIASMLELPEEFLANSHTRGYYGDLVHNVKAVYQRYLSWYDGNPARLNPHPPVDAGKRYVEFMGGADALLGKARESFNQGDYRWVTEVVNHLVFADPSNLEARRLQADALEQLGYQAESSTFRNAYLMGAQELRQGPPPPANTAARARGLLLAMTVEQVFDVMAIRLKSELVGGKKLSVNWTFTDIGEEWILELSNRTLHATRGRRAADAAVGLTLSRATLLSIVNQETTFIDAIQGGQIAIEGDAAALLEIFGNLDSWPSTFAIVEP